MTGLLNVDNIVQTGGLLAIALIIFAETGLLIGFFLPGDTLLIAAGVFAAQHKYGLHIWTLLPVVAIAAYAGYEVGYKIGRAAGPRFFKRHDGLFFKAEYITRSQAFFDRHGIKSILLARFIAIVRTVIPLVAGVGKMDRAKFHFYNIVGAVLWTFSVTLAAFWVGSRIPNIDKYVLIMILLAVFVTAGTVLIGLLRSREKRHELRVALGEEFRYLFKRQG